MLWRARSKSGFGLSFSSPKCIRPSCISACVRRDSVRNSNDGRRERNALFGLRLAGIRLRIRKRIFDFTHLVSLFYQHSSPTQDECAARPMLN